MACSHSVFFKSLYLLKIETKYLEICFKIIGGVRAREQGIQTKHRWPLVGNCCNWVMTISPFLQSFEIFRNKKCCFCFWGVVYV